MLERASANTLSDRVSLVQPWNNDDFTGHDELFDFVYRYLPGIIAFALIGMVCAGIYAYSIEPTFTARTQLLINSQRPSLLASQASEVQVSLDTAEVESQLTVLRSELIGMMVIKDLDLMSSPEFQGRRSSRLARLSTVALDRALEFGWIDEESAKAWRANIARMVGVNKPLPGEGLTPEERARLALAIYEENLAVSRVGVSYVIEIAFRSRDSRRSGAHRQRHRRGLYKRRIAVTGGSGAAGKRLARAAPRGSAQAVERRDAGGTEVPCHA